MRQVQGLLHDIQSKCEDKSLMYKMNWKPGDFGIIDNLAIAHFAPPGTQRPSRNAGVRLLWRTTVAGTNRSTKKYVPVWNPNRRRNLLETHVFRYPPDPLPKDGVKMRCGEDDDFENEQPTVNDLADDQKVLDQKD